MFTFSPQDKKIAEIIKITPFKSLVCVCEVTWMIYDCSMFCDGCSWVPCLFWTVKLLLFFRKILHVLAVFQHRLHIWTLSSSDCMILRSIFSHWGQLMDSNTTIKKGSNIHWCSRRTHDALRAGGEHFWTGWRCPNFSYFVEISFLFFFHLVLTFRSNRRYLHVSRKTN